MRPGRFITFEGGEGAGKSTQIGRLVRRLQERGLPVVATREPGGSPRAERIRDALLSGRVKPFGGLAEAVLFASARRDHLAAMIRPALEQGAVVLCDRFADSTRAYQGAEVPDEVLRALERVVVAETRPDLTVILDVPVEVGLARVSGRARVKGGGPDRFEAEGQTFHERLRDAFRAIAEAEPERCVLIDAALDENQVEAAVWTAVGSRLGLAGASQPERDVRAVGEA